MSEHNNNELIRSLTLVLLHMTSWQEGQHPDNAPRSWKSYDWDAMDFLIDEGYIFGNRRNKSVHLTKEGVAKATELLEGLKQAELSITSRT